MKRNTFSKKGLVVAVILLFIGVAFAPSINANVVKDDLVEFDVEFCGLGKKHTVQLTQQEADEVDLLFDDIEHKLSEVETREEAEEIFKEAVVEFDKYGLIDGLSVRQAQNLVTGKYQKEKTIKFIERDMEILDNNENLLCLIAGEADNTRIADVFSLLYAGLGIVNLLLIIGFWLLIPDIIEEIIFKNFPKIGEIFGNIGDILIFFPLIWSATKPLLFGGFITFGDSWVELANTLPIYYRPSNGWVLTVGLNGVKSWEGDFYGHLSDLSLPPGLYGRFIGTKGFSGIKISDLSGNAKFLGYARHVKLDNNHP